MLVTTHTHSSVSPFEWCARGNATGNMLIPRRAHNACTVIIERRHHATLPSAFSCGVIFAFEPNTHTSNTRLWPETCARARVHNLPSSTTHKHTTLNNQHHARSCARIRHASTLRVMLCAMCARIFAAHNSAGSELFPICCAVLCCVCVCTNTKAYHIYSRFYTRSGRPHHKR